MQWTRPGATLYDPAGSGVGRGDHDRLWVVVTGRPEYRPNWLSRPNATTVVLNRLSKRQGAELVEGVTGGLALPAEVMDQVVAKTDGVPLFVEELTRMVMESGILREEAGRYVLDGRKHTTTASRRRHGTMAGARMAYCSCRLVWR